MPLFSPRDRALAAIRVLRDEMGRPPTEPVLTELAELDHLIRKQISQRAEVAFKADIEQILDAIPDAVALFGPDARIHLCNHAVDELYGQGSALGRSALELTRSSELTQAVNEMLRGTKQRLVLTLPPQRTLLAYLTPLPPREGVVVLRDVSESRRMEVARRDFVASASHELKTPVAAIAAATETLLGGSFALSEQARPFLDIIARHASRLSALTKDLLDLTRLESGEWRPTIEEVEISSVVSGTVSLMQERALAKSIHLDTNVPDNLSVLADRRAMEQVLVNLLDNAIKYSPVSSTVSVEAEVENGQALIQVTDSGPGIEARHLPRIFERFYRVDPGRARDSGGTGLGLAIVKHLVQSQKGEVGVDSGSHGSRFWVRMPLAPR
jgi:two-component system phosphate regulon sensor histidine kinase PhoR